MKVFKIILLILFFFLAFEFSYAYEKLDFFDNFHIYTPYIYIIQDDTNIDIVKVLILFHDYENLENEKNTKKKNKDKKEKKKKTKKEKKGKKNNEIDNIDNKNNNLTETDKIDEIDETDKTDNKEIKVYDFATESAKWEIKAEREHFFIMGFDFGEYESFFSKSNMDKVNERVIMEIDRIKNTCDTKEIKVYVAGTNFGGNIAMLFNLLYDNYDGALCMNISQPNKNTMKYLNRGENKNFYFFQCEKNKSMSTSKLNSLRKKLIKEGANAEIVIYKNDKDEVKDVLPQRAYFDAINKIN